MLFFAPQKYYAPTKRPCQAQQIRLLQRRLVFLQKCKVLRLGLYENRIMCIMKACVHVYEKLYA